MGKFLKKLVEGGVKDVNTALDSFGDLVSGKKKPDEWFKDGIERRKDRFQENFRNLGDEIFEKIEKTDRRVERMADKSYSILQIESDKALCNGDVIGIKRGIYYHYGVYIGDNEVIHYQGDGDIGTNNYVVQTSMSEFMKGQDKFFALDFRHIKDEFKDNFNINRFKKIYDNMETIERAKSKLYEGNYDLLFNNCEHFASWCKVGSKEMRQWFSFLHRRYYEYRG